MVTPSSLPWGRVEADRMGNTVVHELFVQDVEHLEKGAVGRYIVDMVGFEMPFGLGVFLSPDMQCKFHNYL